MEAQPLEVVHRGEFGTPPIDLSGIGGPAAAGTVNLKTVYATTPEAFSDAVTPNLVAVIDMCLEAAKAGSLTYEPGSTATKLRSARPTTRSPRRTRSS
jgi:hypothetical protein